MTRPEHAITNVHKSGSFMKAEVTEWDTPSQHNPANALNSPRGQVTGYVPNNCFVTFSYELVDGLGTN